MDTNMAKATEVEHSSERTVDDLDKDFIDLFGKKILTLNFSARKIMAFEKYAPRSVRANKEILDRKALQYQTLEELRSLKDAVGPIGDNGITDQAQFTRVLHNLAVECNHQIQTPQDKKTKADELLIAAVCDKISTSGYNTKTIDITEVALRALRANKSDVSRKELHYQTLTELRTLADDKGPVGDTGYTKIGRFNYGFDVTRILHDIAVESNYQIETPQDKKTKADEKLIAGFRKKIEKLGYSPHIITALQTYASRTLVANTAKANSKALQDQTPEELRNLRDSQGSIGNGVVKASRDFMTEFCAFIDEYKRNHKPEQTVLDSLTTPDERNAPKVLVGTSNSEAAASLGVVNESSTEQTMQIQSDTKMQGGTSTVGHFGISHFHQLDVPPPGLQLLSGYFSPNVPPPDPSMDDQPAALTPLEFDKRKSDDVIRRVFTGMNVHNRYHPVPEAAYFVTPQEMHVMFPSGNSEASEIPLNILQRREKYFALPIRHPDDNGLSLGIYNRENGDMLYYSRRNNLYDEMDIETVQKNYAETVWFKIAQKDRYSGVRPDNSSFRSVEVSENGNDSELDMLARAAAYHYKSHGVDIIVESVPPFERRTVNAYLSSPHQPLRRQFGMAGQKRDLLDTIGEDQAESSASKRPEHERIGVAKIGTWVISQDGKDICQIRSDGEKGITLNIRQILGEQYNDVCDKYDVRIEEHQHPKFAGKFRVAVKDLLDAKGKKSDRASYIHEDGQDKIVDASHLQSIRRLATVNYKIAEIAKNSGLDSVDNVAYRQHNDFLQLYDVTTGEPCTTFGMDLSTSENRKMNIELSSVFLSKFFDINETEDLENPKAEGRKEYEESIRSGLEKGSKELRIDTPQGGQEIRLLSICVSAGHLRETGAKLDKVSHDDLMHIVSRHPEAVKNVLAYMEQNTSMPESLHKNAFRYLTAYIGSFEENQPAYQELQSSLTQGVEERLSPRTQPESISMNHTTHSSSSYQQWGPLPEYGNLQAIQRVSDEEFRLRHALSQQSSPEASAELNLPFDNDRNAPTTSDQPLGRLFPTTEEDLPSVSTKRKAPATSHRVPSNGKRREIRSERLQIEAAIKASLEDSKSGAAQSPDKILGRSSTPNISMLPPPKSQVRRSGIGREGNSG